MNLIVLIGSGAVGKMTVGQELMKITDYSGLIFTYISNNYVFTESMDAKQNLVDAQSDINGAVWARWADFLKHWLENMEWPRNTVVESLLVPDNPVFSRLFRTLSVMLCYGITANFTSFSSVWLDGN